MPVEFIHTLYGVELFTDAMGSAVLLGGITQQSIVTGTRLQGDPTSGDPYVRHQAIHAQKPRATFSTLQIARALDNIGPSGLKIKSESNTGLRLYQRKYDEGSTPASGSNHIRHTIREGLLVPRQLSCSHQDDATLQYEALVTYDGTNDPIVPADSVALPTGLLDDERFTLAAVTIGGVLITQVTNLTLDFGLDAQTEGSNSDIWDTHSSIRSVSPSLTLKGINAKWFSSAVIPLIGKKGTHANTSFYLRKRKDDGSTFVADGTTEHIKFTMCGLAYMDSVIDVQTNQPGEPAIMMPLRYDGTNFPVVIDTTSAL